MILLALCNRITSSNILSVPRMQINSQQTVKKKNPPKTDIYSFIDLPVQESTILGIKLLLTLLNDSC